MKNYKPPCLQAGDKIAIIAPAKKIESENLVPAIKILEAWGLKVVLGRNIYQLYHSFAGTDEQRIQDFQEMLDREDIKAIFCARGGYGVTRIIDTLDFTNFLKSPKWIVGFSDITALHNEIQKYGIETLHGAMPASFATQTTETLDSLRMTLFDMPPDIRLSSISFNKIGEATGKLVGGNLSIIVNTLATPSEIDTVGKLLFLEDVGEYLYHIERMMIQLFRAGKLKDLKGLIIGQFTEIRDQDNSFGKNIQELIAHIIQLYDYPVAYNFPIGHIAHNSPIVCGRQARLIVSEHEAILNQSI